MEKEHRIESIVFDLDGTLIDSADDIGAAGNRLLAEEGERALSRDEVRRFIGDGSRVFVQKAFEAVGRPLDEAVLDLMTTRFIAQYESDPYSLTKPYDAALSTVERLAGMGLKLAICTNKPQALAETILTELGFGKYLAAIAGGDRFPVRKPDPGHLMGVLELIECAPSNTLMVGDNEHDSAVAYGAGTRFALVPYGYARAPLAEIRADIRLHGLGDLIGIAG